MRVKSIMAVVSAGGTLLIGCASQDAARTSRGIGLPDDVGAIQSAKEWHVDMGFRWIHPKLSATEQALDRRLDGPLRLDVLGVFSHPETPIDRKTNLGLGTPYLGLGRRESDRLMWTAYVGGGAWRDRTSQQVAGTSLSVRFRYALYFAGVSAEYYPWGTPRYGSDLTRSESLKRTRPFVLAAVETAFVNARAAGDFSVLGVNLYKDSQGVRDWLFSARVGLGVAIPLDDHWSLNLIGDYAFHLYRPEEYNSWHMSTSLRYSF